MLIIADIIARCDATEAISVSGLLAIWPFARADGEKFAFSRRHSRRQRWRLIAPLHAALVARGADGKRAGAAEPLFRRASLPDA